MSERFPRLSYQTYFIWKTREEIDIGRFAMTKQADCALKGQLATRQGKCCFFLCV